MTPSVDEVTARITEVAASMGRPIVVAIDGGSGAGKSTLAQAVRLQTGAALVVLDNFLNISIPDHAWTTLPVERRLSDVFDWVRVREHAIEPLLAGKPGRWNAFDFRSGLRADGTYGAQDAFTEVAPAPVVLLEGAYSASPPLADVVDLAVLVDVPVHERHRRISAREDPPFLRKWHAIWDEVESYYFDVVRLAQTFDLVVTND
jgi:uridine kinase